MALDVETTNHMPLFGSLEIKADDEVQTWPLMSVNEPLLIVFGYLLFVLILGPAYMRNRKPYILKTPILWYNALQVIFSAYLFYVTISPGIPFLNFFSSKCHLKIDNTREHRMEVSSALWWYLVAKVTELVDTIFFVLRKKYNQVSFFHVYHHSSTFIYTWILLKVAPEEQILFITAINSFIHVLMYSYYALAALGPKYQKYTWWKKYMTTLQIIQISLGIIYLILARISSCNYSVFVTNMLLGNAAFLLLLFLNFYASSYSNKKKE